MFEIPTTVKDKKLVKKRREQIVSAAIKLFSQKGFHKTTLKELAEEAGLSHGNVYDYVGSKEDIFFLIHDFFFQMSMDLFNRNLDNIHDPLEKLRRMIHSEFKQIDQWSDAFLVLYQEGHILKKTYLKKMLQRERQRIEKIENIITECIEQGMLRECNVRLTANLIKSMADAWALKRWDLRGHASKLEAERAILDLVFNGLLQEKNVDAKQPEIDSLKGKLALVVNGGTEIGKAICSFLVSKGLKVIAHVDELIEDREYPIIPEDKSGAISFFSSAVHGPMTQHLFEQIEKDFGHVDIYIQDMGIGNTGKATAQQDQVKFSDRLEDNLRCARDIFQKLIVKKASRRILYIAPWGWDKYIDPIRYETVKGGAVALTEAVAKAMAPVSTNVNCIIPGFIKAVRPSVIERERAEKLTNEIPAGHLGEIQDVLDVVLFLIGDNSRYLTGQVLNVTGGF